MAPHKVRVNAISPGLIEAGLIQSEERKKMSAEIPYGRPGTPDEVSQVLLWLLTSSPSYLTVLLFRWRELGNILVSPCSEKNICKSSYFLIPSITRI